MFENMPLGRYIFLKGWPHLNGFEKLIFAFFIKLILTIKLNVCDFFLIQTPHETPDGNRMSCLIK